MRPLYPRQGRRENGKTANTFDVGRQGAVGTGSNSARQAGQKKLVCDKQEGSWGERQGKGGR